MASLAHFLKSWIVGFCIEGVFYGLEVAFFVASVAFLTILKRSNTVNYPFLIMTCLLFAGATAQFAHDAFGCVSLIKFFVGEHDPQSLPVVAHDDFLLATNILEILNNAMGDVVLIYRCWLVWEKRWSILILPILLFIAYAISAVLGLYGATLAPSSQLYNDPVFVNFTNSCNIISLVVNVLVTSLIAGRLIFIVKRTEKFLPRSHTRQYSSTISIVLESGVIFCAAQIVSIVMWSIQLDTALVGLPISQIYCIVPTLIIVRVGLGRSFTENGGNSTMDPSGSRSRNGSRKILESMQFARSRPTASATNSVLGREGFELESSKPDETLAKDSFV